MPPAPQVMVAGAFGQDNPGDEAVLDAVLAALPGCSVAATFADGRAGSRACRAVPARDPMAVATAALRADLVVVTATVFKTLHPTSGRGRYQLLGNTLALAVATRVLGRPIAMTGVGAGNLDGRTARALARGIAATAGSVEVRDEESAAILRDAGIRGGLTVGADVSWTIVPIANRVSGNTGRPQTERPKTVAVALSHLAGGPELVETLGRGLAELAGDGFAVALQPWQPVQDLPMARAVAARLGGRAEILAPPADVGQAAEWLAGTGVLVGLRFHSLVAAGAAGCPFVAVTHEPKLAGLARRLEQPSVLPTAGGDQLAAAARKAWAGPPPPADAVESERNTASKTLEGLRALAFRRAEARAGGHLLRRLTRAG